MSDQYMKELLRVAVAQICQTIGYNATQTAPLELLQDVLDKFLREFTRDLRRQVEHYNRTEANLNDVTLTLDSINLNVNELLDYINNVEPVPFALEVPKFPARKDSNLNFLKPGSKEVLTRPVHVHDHLPPMLPPEITQQPETPVPSTSNALADMKPFQDNIPSTGTNTIPGDNANEAATNKSLNPPTVLDKSTLQSLFKPSSNLEDGERPTREVSSVVMTTGGYISPAVEGKMPEAIVPDIIDKLLGLDAPPPPAPPPQPKPAPRSATSTPVPTVSDAAAPSTNKVKQTDNNILPSSSSKESKKSLSKILDGNSSNKKSDSLKEMSKKEKLLNAAKAYAHDTHHTQAGSNYNKKSYMMHQNAAGMHTSQTNYANMLLKKAKKQKGPSIPGQTVGEKHGKPVGEKMGKMDANDKAHRKYMKMLQKMAKQGKIPPELLSSIMGPDKKSKMINPAIVASMPPGPEKIQLEKLLRKQAKQRQKTMKQQMTTTAIQKQSKKIVKPPPLIPIFPLGASEGVIKPLHVDLDEQKLKIAQQKELLNISPAKATFTPNILTPPSGSHLPESLISSNTKSPVAPETPPIEIMDTPKTMTSVDGKDLKLSNEPDRTKLNIFKKISKQKTPKSSSPTPMRITGLADTSIINLPSGTTITPAPGPTTSSLTSTPVGRNLFPPLPEATSANNIINLDDIKDKPLTGGNGNPNQPTDLTMFNRVFGEKPNNDVELVNKPKKRGRKPGSKNSPKIPGVFPNNSFLKKNSKKLKMDNTIFGPQMQIPPDYAAAASNTAGNLTYDNMAQLFGNPINPMEWAKQKQLQQQMMIMAAAKERKEHKKKNKLLKQDLSKSDNTMASMTMMTNTSAVPTNEEVQSINRKLMRMDTILKPAPSSSNDLSIDTSLITGKKLPSPSMFPSSSTSPLKSPGNSKRNLMASVDAVMAASLGQPFMLPNRPAFPNLPSSMLSMLQFPFPTRPGLIPTPGLFPTPGGLGGFPNNPKNPLLPGLFNFPNLKQSTSDNMSSNLESEDLTTDKKKSETHLHNSERSYCNVAPLVPEFLTKLNESSNKYNNEHHLSETDLPKTPKPRNSHSNTMAQDNLLKKMVDAHTPESAGGSIKSIPTTPGGMSLNTFEQLMKKNDSPIDLLHMNKQSKALSSSQESGLDFSMNKKSQGLTIKTPITLNNEPIEVSDDSDETNQQQPPPQSTTNVKTQSSPANVTTQLPTQQPPPQKTFNMDEMFVANAVTTSVIHKSMETDLSTKELKKLKKQVKKSATSITSSLINADKSEGSGVGKLAGGADLIPLTSTGLAYSAKNIPFNSLTANANPSFNNHKNEFNSSATSHPPTSSATSSVFDNLTITAAIPMSMSSTSSIFELQKKRKEHKKLKKLKELKEGKIKKKKDKKDKTKSKEKEKAEKYLLTQTETLPPKEKEPPAAAIVTAPSVVIPASSGGSGGGGGGIGSGVTDKIKDKDLLKKLKKEKKKEKQRSANDELPTQNLTTPPTSTTSSTTRDLLNPSSASVAMGNEAKKQKLSPSAQNSVLSGNEQELLVAKAPSSIAPPTAAAIVPKLTLKLGSTQSPTPPFEDPSKSAMSVMSVPAVVTSPPRDHHREPSPELARISPLVTRPPKHKLNTSGELATSSSATTNSISAGNASSLEIGDNINKPSSSTSNPNVIVPPPSPWLSGGTISASSVLLPHQLLQTTKHHDLTTTPTSATHITDPQKTTNTDRQSPLTLITETSRPSSYIDAEGNRVWICPACGKVDDGSPMIGCDGCDAWYHWLCVGIFVAPKDNEDWFCRVCITRKKGLHGSDKKRKRNKKK